MAFETQQVYLTALKQAGIGRAMRRVAGTATFDLHCLMLEDKRTGLVRVAFETDGVLGDSRSRLAKQESTVRIVAIVAFH